MLSVTANDLKTKGVTLFSDLESHNDEALITVRGKQKYAVVDIEYYNYLRECELEAALAESRKDIAEGKCVVESVEDHIARITNAL